MTSQGVLPKGGSFVQCTVDSELRTKIGRPTLPAPNLASLQLYTGRLSDDLDVSEGRTASAVTALDACNAVNAEVQLKLAPKRPWWVLWARGS